jgi:hypothetical protein
VKPDPREKSTAFELRVNGMVVEASMRRTATNSEECEVLIRDPLVGEFALHEEFAIDVRKYAGSEPIWSRVSLRHLKSTFLEATSSDLPSIKEILESELFRKDDAGGAAQPNAQSSEAVLVAAQARRAQRILYLAGIPSIVMSLTPHRMHNAEGALIVPDLRVAVRELSAHGFKPGPLKYLLLDTKTGNTLRLVQRWVADKGARDGLEL